MADVKHWAVIRNLASDALQFLQLLQDKLLNRQSAKTVDTAELYSNIRVDILLLTLGEKALAREAAINKDGSRPPKDRKEILDFSWKLGNATGAIINEIIANKTEPVAV